MSSQRSSRTSKLTEGEINDLMLRLQALLPQLKQTSNSRASSVSVRKIIKETCSHINKLQKEVEDLGKRITELMDSADIGDIDEEH